MEVIASTFLPCLASLLAGGILLLVLDSQGEGANEIAEGFSAQDLLAIDPRFQRICSWSAAAALTGMLSLATEFPPFLLLMLIAVNEIIGLAYWPPLTITIGVSVLVGSTRWDGRVLRRIGHVAARICSLRSDLAGGLPPGGVAMLWRPAVGFVLWTAEHAANALQWCFGALMLTTAPLFGSRWTIPSAEVRLAAAVVVWALVVIAFALAGALAVFTGSPPVDTRLAAAGAAATFVLAAILPLVMIFVPLISGSRPALAADTAYVPKQKARKEQDVFSAQIAGYAATTGRSKRTPKGVRRLLIVLVYGVGCGLCFVASVIVLPSGVTDAVGGAWLEVVDAQIATPWFATLQHGAYSRGAFSAAVTVTLGLGLVLLYRMAQQHVRHVAVVFAGRLPLYAQREWSHRLNNLLSAPRVAVSRAAKKFENTPKDAPVQFSGEDRNFIERRLKASCDSLAAIDDWLNRQLRRAKDETAGITRQLIAKDRTWTPVKTLAYQLRLAAQGARDDSVFPDGSKIVIRFGVSIDGGSLHCISFTVAEHPDLGRLDALLEGAEARVSYAEFLDALIAVLKNAVDAVHGKWETMKQSKAQEGIEQSKLWSPRIDLIFRINRTTSDPLCICVIDNGPGIAEDLRDKIGQIYVSTKGIMRHGVGLFMARQTILAHGGRLTYSTSTEETRSFTEFVFLLPLEAVRLSESWRRKNMEMSP